jgi:two-component system chemotaxis response regulator CheY
MAVKALIADDSFFIREMIRRHLERIGCEVVAEAENASQALSLFRSVHPDLITLDIVMTEADGVDTLAAFRTMRQEAPQVPIILMTAMPFGESREAFMSNGALDYIVKPFNNETFDQIRRKLVPVFPELDKGRAGASATQARRSSL